jgi:hypothetical protein
MELNLCKIECMVEIWVAEPSTLVAETANRTKQKRGGTSDVAESIHG